MKLFINLLLLGVFTVGSLFSARSQDIIFINQGEKAIVYDTSIIRHDSRINRITFRPQYRNPSNTQFFERPIDLSRVKIDSCQFDWIFFRHLIISEATFQSKVYFNQAYSDTLFIEKSRFPYGLLVNQGQIEKFSFTSDTASVGIFIDMKFTKARFDHTHFEEAWFSNCIFDSLSFHHAAFLRNLVFSGCTFKGHVVFDSCSFPSGFKLPSFPYANASFSFIRTKLPDTIDFSENPVIGSVIDLTKADFEGNQHKHLIFLYNADIAKINIDYTYFKLLLIDPKTGKELPSSDAKRIYETLLKSFKEKGQEDSYEMLRQEYEEYKVSLLPLLDKLWFFYAGKPTYVVSWMIIWLLVFTIINIGLYRKLNNEVYTLSHFSQDSQRFTDTKIKKFFNEIFFGFIYTAIIFFAFNIRKEQLRYNKRLLLVWFFAIYAVGIVSIFLVAQLAFRK